MAMRSAARTAFLVTALAASAASAFAYELFPDKEPPLYPQYILPVDDSLSADPELASFRAALAEATETLTHHDTGRHLDPEAMRPFLADEVEIFVAQGPRTWRHEFVSLGTHPALTALAMLGRMAQPREARDDLVAQRLGMYAVKNLLTDPTVGASEWLAGRICTAAYGKMKWPDWIALNGKLNFALSEWAIAVQAVPEAGELLGVQHDWPRKYQLVPISPEQKRSAGSIGIIPPEDSTVFFKAYFDSPTSLFAPYLNNHICFGRTGAGWKVTAFAWRLES